MLTDKCKAVIDEALATNGNYAILSVEASAHLESCLECRRSLESIKALKASAASVIPAVSPALKAKIASSLEGAMQARKAATAGSSLTKPALLTGSIVVGIGLAGALTLGIVLSDNKNEVSKNIPEYKEQTMIQSKTGESPIDDLATSSLDIKTNNEVTNNILKSDSSNEDMRSHETIKYPTQNIPSAKKDSDIK